MPNSIFAEGRTTNEAIENGLKQLNAKREDVIINVIGNEEKRSFFSILEPTKIKVELTLKEPVKIKKANITDEELNEVLETMKKFSNDFFNQLKINNLSINVEEKEKRIYISVTGDDINYLIGYRGETLESIQNIISAIANKETSARVKIIVDILNYKEKRRNSLEILAKKVEKTTQNLLTEQNPYNIITKCDVVRDA